MLINLTRRLVRGLRSSRRINLTVVTTRKWNRSEIVKKLLEEEDIYHNNIAPDNPEFDQDFAAGGWKVKFDEDSTRFEIEKQTATHQAYISTHVKDNPPNLPGNPPPIPAPLRPSNWKKNQTPSMSQVKVFIRRKGQPRWFVTEMLVMDGQVQLAGAFFTYLSPGPDWEKHVYPGPELQTVPEYVLASINALMLELGINTQFLANFVLFSEQPVDRLDLKWIRNIREMYE